MMKLIIFLLFINFCFAQKLSMDQRRTQILEIINEELTELVRLNRQQKGGSPQTMIRLSELYLEKGRLYREVENEKYMAVPPQKRVKVSKKKYFETSTKFFDEANAIAENVIRKYPRHQGVTELYYILAFNNKELNNHKKAEKYFQLAIGKNKANTKIGAKARLALADYKYNAKKFNEAIPLYEVALKNVDEAWWTKDAFNLAWCYYRVKRYSKAIDLMKTVYRKSSSEKYINMQSNVLRDIALFYLDGKDLEGARQFYQSIGQSYVEQFQKIALTYISQGRFSQAETLLKSAESRATDEKSKYEIWLTQLILFEKSSQDNKHLIVSTNLVKNYSKLDEEQKKSLQYQISRQAALLQKKSASNLYKNVPKTRTKKANLAISYFALQSQINSNKAESIFFQGETAFAANMHERALNYYLESFDSAKNEKNSKIQSQSIEGMLSALGQKSLGAKTANKYYQRVYENYLAYDSKSPRAKSIYEKLFNFHFSNKDLVNAEKTLLSYKKSPVNDVKTQEAMLAKIMDYHEKNKNFPEFRRLVEDINDGKYQVSAKYKSSLKSILTKIQIQGVQASLDKGDKATALRGYIAIYDNKESTENAKSNAAYNLAALYYEMNDPAKSYEWSIKSIEMMSNKEVAKFSDSYLTIATWMFLNQRFDLSINLNHQLYYKICKENSAQKDLIFKNQIYILLAENRTDKAYELMKTGKTCSVKEDLIAESSIEVLKDLSIKKQWSNFQVVYDSIKNNTKIHPHLIYLVDPWIKELRDVGDTVLAQEVQSAQNSFYQSANSTRREIPAESLRVIAYRMYQPISQKISRIDSMNLSFPEEVFNQTVKARLQLLDQVTSEIKAIQKLGEALSIVESTLAVANSYEKFGQELASFTPPEKSADYVQSFKKAMQSVANPLIQNSRKQKVELANLVKKNKIISNLNPLVFNSSDIPKMAFPRFGSELMDRGGK